MSASTVWFNTELFLAILAIVGYFLVQNFYAVGFSLLAGVAHVINFFFLQKNDGTYNFDLDSVMHTETGEKVKGKVLFVTDTLLF